jgi:hypothetical protein
MDARSERFSSSPAAWDMMSTLAHGTIAAGQADNLAEWVLAVLEDWNREEREQGARKQPQEGF